MRFHVLKSVSDLSEFEWRELTRTRSAFQRRSWYENAPGRGEPRLFVAEEAGRAVLALPMFLIDGPGHYYDSPAELLTGAGEREMLAGQGLDDAPLTAARAAEWYPAMISMSPYGYRGGLLSTGAVPPSGIAEFVRFVLGHCSASGVRVVSFHYLVEHEDALFRDVLVAAGGTPAMLGASCHLDLRWASAEDYLSWLGPSRRSIGGDYRKADREPGVTWSALPQWQPSAAQRATVRDLFLDTMARHGDTGPPLTLVDNCAGGRVDNSVFFLSETERIRGAVLALAEGGVLHPKFFGTRAPRRDYLPLGYWHTLRYALANGFDRVDFGGGATRVKLWRGADLYWDTGVFFFADDLRDRAVRAAELMSGANTTFFTELCRRWHRTHAAPPPPSFVG